MKLVSCFFSILPTYRSRNLTILSHVRMRMMVLICGITMSVSAQVPEKSDEIPDACDIQIAPIDTRQLAADPERTKARIVARMLQDMDRCLGLEQSRIASAQAGNTFGPQTTAQKGQNAPASVSSVETATSAEEISHDSQSSVENTTSSSSTDESNESTLSDAFGSSTDEPTSTQHNTTLLNIGSDDELILDDYAKTLHEAYQVETDPVLKEALGKELTNYLSNKKQ